MFRKVSFNSIPNELLTILVVVVVVAFILASYVLCPWLNKESVATLTGAVIGAVAVFFGNLQNQRAQKQLAENASREKASKIRLLIGQDLLNVALGLIGADKQLKAAIAQASANHQAESPLQELQELLPREMYFSKALIRQFVELRSDELEALITVLNGLDLTLRDINQSKHSRTKWDDKKLRESIRQDLVAIKFATAKITPELRAKIPPNSSHKLLTEIICDVLYDATDQSVYPSS